MCNSAYGDRRMHMGIPVCKRAGIAEKFADGDPITHNEIVRIWGLTYTLMWVYTNRPTWELIGTNTPTWERIGTVTWVYTNTLTRELNRYRPDRTGPDQTDRQTDRHTLNLSRV